MHVVGDLGAEEPAKQVFAALALSRDGRAHRESLTTSGFLGTYRLPKPVAPTGDEHAGSLRGSDDESQHAPGAMDPLSVLGGGPRSTRARRSRWLRWAKEPNATLLF